MITFCATSASLRVRYPEFAVFSAVSARPLRAPCVEMKYSSTDRPSRKFALIGFSMISPDGLAIRPRMAASWRICWVEARLFALLAGLAVDHDFATDAVHHLFGDAIGDAGPDVDDLVVALAVGDETF